jgi:hypothetical protein
MHHPGQPDQDQSGEQAKKKIYEFRREPGRINDSKGVENDITSRIQRKDAKGLRRQSLNDG